MRHFRVPARIAALLAIVSLALAAPAAASPTEWGSRGDAAPRPPAGDGDEAQEPVARPGGFELQSEVMAVDPDVAAALELTATTPSDPGAWRALGTVLAEKGAFADSIAAFERAVDLEESADAYADLGAALVRSGRTARGAAALRRAVRIEPFHAVAHYNLGLAYDELDRYDEALDEFETALTIDPRLGDPKYNASAATNRHLPIVKLRVYMRTVGASAARFSLPAAESDR